MDFLAKTWWMTVKRACALHKINFEKGKELTFLLSTKKYPHGYLFVLQIYFLILCVIQLIYAEGLLCSSYFLLRNYVFMTVSSHIIIYYRHLSFNKTIELVNIYIYICMVKVTWDRDVHLVNNKSNILGLPQSGFFFLPADIDTSRSDYWRSCWKRSMTKKVSLPIYNLEA